MIVAGDEFGRTQGGNNNAYCQDNDISWVNWELSDEGRALTGFVQKLTTLRHTLPALRRGRFLTGEFDDAAGVHDVRWLNTTGRDLTPEQWADSSMRCFGLVIDGRARATGIRRPASDATLLLVFNSYHDVVNFTLPEISGSDDWSCLIDTNVPVREELPKYSSGDVYQLTGRSLLLFALEARGETQEVFDKLEAELTDAPADETVK
jgi:glycogen operon protein